MSDERKSLATPTSETAGAEKTQQEIAGKPFVSGWSEDHHWIPDALRPKPGRRFPTA
jgi:hypothetical protein